MHYNTLLATTLAILSNLALTSASPHHTRPTPTFVTPPPPGETYAIGYPLCGVPGYTVVPGNYTETVGQQTNATLKGCYKECRVTNGACKSIAYHARYTLCLFFDRVVEETQLEKADDSEFVHWDLKCHV